MLDRLDPKLVGELAGVLARVLEWDGDREKAEIERAVRILRDKHRLELA